jgi:hypothetical protein
VRVPEPDAEKDHSASGRPWLRWIAYAGAVLLWVAASALKIPLLIAGFFWAAVIRGIYVFVRRRRNPSHPFWSPWLFVLAALCSLLAIAGQQAREGSETDAAAVSLGVVSTEAAEITPVQRCVTKVLQDWNELPEAQQPPVPGGIRAYAGKFCGRASRDGVLGASGGVYPTDTFMAGICAEGVMGEFDRVPKDQRAFNRPDFRIFAKRFCAEAIDRGLIEGARSGKNRDALDALQDEVLSELLAEGTITRVG